MIDFLGLELRGDDNVRKMATFTPYTAWAGGIRAKIDAKTRQRKLNRQTGCGVSFTGYDACLSRTGTTPGGGGIHTTMVAKTNQVGNQRDYHSMSSYY